jgi:hypothetical protein
MHTLQLHLYVEGQPYSPTNSKSSNVTLQENNEESTYQGPLLREGSTQISCYLEILLEVTECMWV